jgi:hypothetical protein
VVNGPMKDLAHDDGGARLILREAGDRLAW